MMKLIRKKSLGNNLYLCDICGDRDNWNGKERFASTRIIVRTNLKMIEANLCDRHLEEFKRNTAQLWVGK